MIHSRARHAISSSLDDVSRGEAGGGRTRHRGHDRPAAGLAGLRDSLRIELQITTDLLFQKEGVLRPLFVLGRKPLFHWRKKMKTRRFKVLMFVLAQVVFARYLTADGGGHRHASAPLPLSQIEGTITAASATSITVHDSHGNDVVLTLTSTTLIRKGDETIAAADLNAGDQVHVAALTQNNTTTAVLVIVQMQSDEREIERPITPSFGNSITRHVSTSYDVVASVSSAC